MYLRQAFNQLKTKVNQELYKARRDYFSKKVEQHKDDLMGTWTFIKHAIGQENKSISVEQMCFNGKDITDKKEIVESFN